LTQISQISKKNRGSDIVKYVPSFIFLNRNHTILEALVVFLRESKKLSYRKIANLLSRDHRFVYNSYANAKDKELVTTYTISPNYRIIPVSIFSDKKFPALEALVLYLKDDCSLAYHKIALLLNRNDRTIWTVYQRAKKKKWLINRK